MTHSKFEKNLKFDELILAGLSSGELDFDEAEKLIDEALFFSRQSNILEWGKYYFTDKFELPFCHELHDYLINIAFEPRTSTLAPRGHAKTTIKCFLIPLYIALNYPEMYRHFVNVQATSTKAVAVNISIKTELENNELLQKDYGVQVTREKWTEKQFILKNGVIFTAIGAGESFRGKNYRNIRPDYVIIDDLYDDDDMENPLRILKKNAWFWGTVYKSVAIGKSNCIHIQGTAIHDSDLMHITSKSERWVSRTFKACDFETGYVLWPEANTIQSLEYDMQEMGTIIFNREMLNITRDDSTSIIKLAYIQLVDEIPANEQIIWRLGAIDPAEKTKEINDFTAKVALYVTENKDIYITDIRNNKFTFNENFEDASAWHDLHDFDGVPFETNKAFGLYEELKRRTSVPVRERIADTDKLKRLLTVSSFFENRKVFILKTINERVLSETVNQLINNYPSHDDIRDAIVLGIEEVRRTRSAFVG